MASGGGHKFNALVGVRNKGQLNLLKNTRSRMTQQVREETLEAHTWASNDRYRKQALDGQLKTLSEEISKWTTNVTRNAEKVLINAFTPTFQKSQYYCPVSLAGSRPYYQSGTLRDSGKLKIVRSGGVLANRNSSITASITYGGNGVPFYAVYVHEIPRQHVYPTRYKFLEQALKEDMGEIKRRLSVGARKVASGK